MRAIIGSGAFLQRFYVAGLMEPRVSSPVALRPGELNRLRLTAAGVARLPPITPAIVGVPIIATLLSSDHACLFAPSGRSLGGRTTPRINGDPLGLVSSAVGLHVFVTDGQTWHALTPASAASAAGGGGPLDVFSFAGPGSDGPLVASAGTTTLTRATYLDYCHLTGTAAINRNRWPLYVRTLDATGGAQARSIYNKGTDIAAGSPVATPSVPPRAGGYLPGGGLSGNGANAGGPPNTVGNPGGTAAALDFSAGGVGGGGGAGGAGNSGKAGGAGGGNGSTSNQIDSIALAPFDQVFSLSLDRFTYAYGGSGGGGGGSGGGSTGINSGQTGMAGGGGGPVSELYVGELITDATTPAAYIDSFGGGVGAPLGTPSGGGGAGAGGGGGGGFERVVIGKRTGPLVPNLICANGAPGGNAGPAVGGGGAGVGGRAGGGGRIIARVLSTGQVISKAIEGPGPAAVGSVGGVPTLWGIAI